MSFEKLLQLNVNDKVEKKNGLSYLSWSFAWSNFKKEYPKARYEIMKFANKEGVELPYMYDPNTGYMVMTRVVVDGLTHEMWLPVMDGANRAMKSEPYEVKTKYKSFTVAAATMFDINKTIMRCLVKNLAMFGLGLYIYAGEDLPEEPQVEDAKKKDNASKSKTTSTVAPKKEEFKITPPKKITAAQVKKLQTMRTEKGIEEDKIKDYIKSNFKITSTKDLTPEQFEKVCSKIEKTPKKDEHKAVNKLKKEEKKDG